MNEKDLDKLTFVAVVNGHTLSKEKGVLVLNDVDPTNPAHKYVLSCMDTLRQVTNTDIKIRLKKGKLISWWKLKRKFKFLKGFKLTPRAGKKMQDFIYDIEDANNMPGAFAKAWGMYYVD